MARESYRATQGWRAARLFFILLLVLGPAAAHGQNRASPSPSQTQAASTGRGGVAQRAAAARGVRQGDLDKWMHSRVAWVALFGGIAGFLLSWLYLTRLSYGGGLQIERQARHIFFVTLVFIVLPAVLLVLFADMYLYAFSGHLAFTLLAALLGTQGLLLAVAALLLFTVVTVGVTRFKSGSRCPYMLWPRPKIG